MMGRTSLAMRIAIVLLAAAGGCKVAQQLGQSYLRKRTIGGTTTLLQRSIDDVLHKAVAELEQAWGRRLAERREADAREEEARRIRTSEAQLFYAGLCTTRGIAPAGVEGTREAEAEAAYAAGDHARAAALLRALHAEAEERSDGGDAEPWRLANRAAVAYLAAGDDRAAMELAVRALEQRKELREVARGGGKDAEDRADLDVAESQLTVAQIFRAAGAYGPARQGLAEALEARARRLGEGHLCVAEAQNALGELEYVTGGYASAMELYREALATRERQLAEGHRDLAQSYVNLGSLHKAIALYAPARAYYERALAARRKLGEGHPEVADAYHHLAALHRVMGDLPRAESFYQKALAIRVARSPDGLEVAATETALAELALSYGDHDRADALLQRALAIRRARLPADHPDLAETLVELARLHQATREPERSEREAREALAIWEKRLGPEHPAVARGEMALGELELARGRYAEAEPHLARARAIRERKLGAENPATAESLHALGTLHYARLDAARAEPLLRRAVEVRSRALGPGHPDVAASRSYLAALLVATGRPQEALDAFREAQLASEQLVESLGAIASEARFDALLRFLRAQEDVVYSLLADRELAPRAAPLALSVALLRKGRSVDGAASISQAVYQGLRGADRATFDELRALRAQMAYRKLAPVEGIGAREPKELERRAERIESDLALRSAPVRARRELPGLDRVVQQVAAALPPGAALVEVVRYRPYAFRARAGEPRWRDPRYVALVLDGARAIQVVDLGDAATLDLGVKAYLRAVTAEAGARDRAEAEAELRRASRELEARVVEPIRPHLAGKTSIVFSPDGQLNLLPLWTLRDGTEYLIDRFEVAYVTSGRDLLPRPALRHSTEVAVFARPDFVRGGGALAQVEPAAWRGLEIVEGPPSLVLPSLLAPGAVRLRAPPNPLRGTEQEARAIAKLLPSARLRIGGEATKERFLGVEAPAVLHVATHGLFQPERTPERRSERERGLAVAGALLSPPAAGARRSEPLLGSMLLWAGVGVPLAGEGSAVVLQPSGLATALEVAGMNLWGTQLVVLSACETGRGQVDDLGQGVHGLRRAVMVAGAETLVTSLWKVDDEVTRDLMRSYYARLLAGAGRVQALREASLAVRRQHPEPRHWGPFIAVGQVGPVRGLE